MYNCSMELAIFLHASQGYPNTLFVMTRGSTGNSTYTCHPQEIALCKVAAPVGSKALKMSRDLYMLPEDVDL